MQIDHVEEIKKAKRDTEVSISRALNNFITVTGLNVQDVELTVVGHDNMAGRQETVVLGVKLKVEL